MCLVAEEGVADSDLLTLERPESRRSKKGPFAVRPKNYGHRPPRPLALPAEVWMPPPGRNPECYGSRATLIADSSCLTLIDTFRSKNSNCQSNSL